MHFLNSLIGLCSAPGTLLKNDCLNECMHERIRYQIEQEPKSVFDRADVAYLFVIIPPVCNSDSKHLSLLFQMFLLIAVDIAFVCLFTPPFIAETK